ncbi:class I SAM-dependent methyltransferase [Bacillus sp. HMF5848]|uniref:class I SAM-dependent methyltransferase n=1 Tax=Bacillus sp. HMF5848 TaxID=2495421 RepID=UPI000F7AFEC9|nr:class I SAM-dependent methyltransferase [Bacillus sp. HMF5848]RSK27623.1 class I SAM-dependent methyltransferase [Bacillus sp. HMF5848]
MEKFFGFAKSLIEKGIAVEECSYGENNLYDVNITDTSDFFFYTQLAKEKNGKVLDIGCGTGRILKNLFESGYKDLVGMDISKDMLLMAQEKLGDDGLTPKLVVGDMRDFSLNEVFSLIIIPNCSMIYIYNDEDRKKVFHSVFKHLDVGGVFAFDFDAEVVPQGETRPWISSQAIHPKTGEVVLSTVQIKGIHQNLRLMNMINYRYISAQDAKISVNTSFEATCDPDKMKDLLENEGFTLRGFYSDYNFSPYTGGDLCVVVAEK